MELKKEASLGIKKINSGKQLLRRYQYFLITQDTMQSLSSCTWITWKCMCHDILWLYYLSLSLFNCHLNYRHNFNDQYRHIVICVKRVVKTIHCFFLNLYDVNFKLFSFKLVGDYVLIMAINTDPLQMRLRNWNYQRFIYRDYRNSTIYANWTSACHTNG